MVCLQTKLNLVKGITQKELSEVVSELGEGIVTLDRKGLVLSINSEAEKLLGWQASELSGQDFFSLGKFALKDVMSLGSGSQCPALKTIHCPHLNISARIVRKDGVEIPIKFMLTSFFSDDGGAGKLFVFSQEIEEEDIQLPREVVDSVASIIIQLNMAGEIIFANRHGQWLFGDVSPESLVPETIQTLLAESPHLLDQQTLLDQRRIDGQEREVCIAWSVAIVRDSLGDVTGVICVGNDFTDHHHTLKKRLQEGGMAHKVFEHISDGVITVNCEGYVEYLNPSAEQLTGWSREEALGQALKDVYHLMDEQSLEGMNDSVDRCLRGRCSVESQGSWVLLRRGGWELIVQDSATPIYDAEGNITGAVVVFSDVSELRGMERRLEYESNHDLLTGLINRREFESRLRATLESVSDGGQRHALFYLDLDQFKLINDSYGHAAGDRLLKEISVLLEKCLGNNDNLARLGGDEFGVIFENCSMEKARLAAKALCDAVRDFHFEWGEKTFEISVSIGLVPVTSQWRDASEIMRLADSACHVAKEHGRNRIHVYQPEDSALRQREGDIQWVQRIRHALKENRFQLYCQNIVPLSEESTSGTHYEILLRMMAEDGTVIRPAAFLGAAERYRLMPMLDRWVVSEALQLLGERHRRGECTGIFAINISGQSLDDEHFLDFVVEKLRHSDVLPEMICFEITETVAATHLKMAQHFMAVLKNLGLLFCTG